MTHINYYDKYIKYKNKYTQYKKQIYCNENMTGGGIPGSISFCTESHEPIHPIPNILSLDATIYIKLTVVDSDDKYYKIIRKAGEGSTGFVYLIEEQQLQPPSQPPPQFVIKFNKINRDNEDYEIHKHDNSKEGEKTERLSIPDHIKALYQGTIEVDFVIYNFLGVDLLPFLQDHPDISSSNQLSLIRQLHEQLYTLNTMNQFHNDVKCSNIVVSPNPSPNPNLLYQLSLIDYGIYTSPYSRKGASISMCMRGCAQFCMDLLPSDKISVSPIIQNVRDFSLSTDYVGFFNFVINLICKSEMSYYIYSNILDLQNDHSYNDCIKILCLLCYISIDSNPSYNAFLRLSKSIVDAITKKLSVYKNHFTLFEFVRDRDPNKNRLVLFLCFVYDNIHPYCMTPTSIVHITKLPKLLWDLGSTCLQPRFYLEKFNTNYYNIFTDDLHLPLVPLP